MKTTWCSAVLLGSILLSCPLAAKAAAIELQAEPTSSAPASPPAAVPAPTPAPTPAPVAPATKIAPPPAGKGQIVFFRPFELLGLALSFDVREGEADLGHLSLGRYLVIVSEPGTHTYSMRSEAKTSVTLEIESGETYYVKQTMTVGFLVHRPNLTPSDEASFDAAADKLKEMQP